MKTLIAILLLFVFQTSATTITITAFPTYGCAGNISTVIFQGRANTCTAGRVNGAAGQETGYIMANCVLQTGTDADRTLYTKRYADPNCAGEFIQKDFDLSFEFCSNQDTYGYLVECSASNIMSSVAIIFVMTLLLLNKF